MPIFNKKLLVISLCVAGVIAATTSNTTYADIYKWRDSRGIIQYSDKPPAGAVKASQAEIINALQPKALCADPVAAAKVNNAKIDANFFSFNSPIKNTANINSGFIGRPANAGKNMGIGGLAGFGGNRNFNSPAAAASKPIRNFSGFGGFAGRNNTPRDNTPRNNAPRNNSPSFAGLNPTSFFNVGSKPVTVFGRPTGLAGLGGLSAIGGLGGLKPVDVASPKPVVAPVAPAPLPVAQAPNNPAPANPAPTNPVPANPAPSNTPTAGNIIQYGLMPAVDISKNMAPVIGASEPFIGKAEPPAPGDGDGQFRTICRPSHMSNDDPIIYPNQQGATHLHTFFGNTSLNFKSDLNNLRNTGTSTCKGGTANLSAYWVPSMIDTATKTALVPSDGVFYYKTGYTVKRELVTAPPKGLRIIAGNSKSAVSQRENQYTNHVRYNCVLPDNKALPESDSIPACAQGSIIHSVVQFPNCWDGKNLDSPDHQSHMAYAKYGVGCPATHPTAIPTITFNIFYRVTQAAGTANWRLASDNYAKSGYNAGYSGHADWVNGWDANIIKIGIENCDNKGLDCGVGNLGNGTGLWFKKDSEY